VDIQQSDSDPCPSARTRWRRGILCWLTFVVTPLGWFCRGRLIRRMEPERLEHGLVMVLTGIEGRSFLNVGLLAGLIDGGVRSAMEIVDWTTGNRLLVLFHLRGWKRNNRVALELANKVIAYQDQYPGRPVWLVGHSGGGGMSLLIAGALPPGRKVTGIVMLATAVSPRVDFGPALANVQTSIWNYYSWFDLFFLWFGTTVLGTIDGPHGPAAGAIGLRSDKVQEAESTGRLIQVPWHWRMIKQFNLGEHFGCVHRVFVAEEIAPLIRASEVGRDDVDADEARKSSPQLHLA
jgi:pimeloyl-ACP methyl ester carboxylesterase